MIQLLKRVARIVGLERPAREVFWALRARGLIAWKPLVPEDSFCDCVRQAVAKLQELEPSERLGDYLEFGVSRGTSMACTYSTLRHAGLNHMRLIGFDSFEGLPMPHTGATVRPGSTWARGPAASSEGWIGSQSGEF